MRRTRATAAGGAAAAALLLFRTECAAFCVAPLFAVRWQAGVGTPARQTRARCSMMAPPPPFVGGPRPTGGASGRRGNKALPVAKEPDVALNDAIDAPEVRVIISNPEGDEMAGIMRREDAMAKAEELGMDLVMISETAKPPVVKIIDYGKFKYQAEKKEKDKKKGSKQADMKEVKMSYKIDTHDYDVRVKNAIKWLAKGSRVKVMVEFRGRERQHINLGRELLDKVLAEAAEVATADRINLEGNRLGVILSPKKES